MHNATGRCAHLGGCWHTPEGSGPPPPPHNVPGAFYVLSNPTFPCCQNRCQGPLAPILETLADLLPRGWRYQNDPRNDPPAVVERQKAIRVNLKPLPFVPTAIPSITPPLPIGRKRCCECGPTGGCWYNGVDCRLLNSYLQRMRGEC